MEIEPSRNTILRGSRLIVEDHCPNCGSTNFKIRFTLFDRSHCVCSICHRKFILKSRKPKKSGKKPRKVHPNVNAEFVIRSKRGLSANIPYADIRNRVETIVLSDYRSLLETRADVAYDGIRLRDGFRNKQDMDMLDLEIDYFMEVINFLGVNQSYDLPGYNIKVIRVV